MPSGHQKATGQNYTIWGPTLQSSVITVQSYLHYNWCSCTEKAYTVCNKGEEAGGFRGERNDRFQQTPSPSLDSPLEQPTCPHSSLLCPFSCLPFPPSPRSSRFTEIPLQIFIKFRECCHHLQGQSAAILQHNSLLNSEMVVSKLSFPNNLKSSQ